MVVCVFGNYGVLLGGYWWAACFGCVLDPWDRSGFLGTSMGSLGPNKHTVYQGEMNHRSRRTTSTVDIRNVPQTLDRKVA